MAECRCALSPRILLGMRKATGHKLKFDTKMFGTQAVCVVHVGSCSSMWYLHITLPTLSHLVLSNSLIYSSRYSMYLCSNTRGWTKASLNEPSSRFMRWVDHILFCPSGTFDVFFHTLYPLFWVTKVFFTGSNFKGRTRYSLCIFVCSLWSENDPPNARAKPALPCCLAEKPGFL